MSTIKTILLMPFVWHSLLLPLSISSHVVVPLVKETLPLAQCPLDPTVAYLEG